MSQKMNSPAILEDSVGLFNRSNQRTIRERRERKKAVINSLKCQKKGWVDFWSDQETWGERGRGGKRKRETGKVNKKEVSSLRTKRSGSSSVGTIPYLKKPNVIRPDRFRKTIMDKAAGQGEK